MSPTAQSFKSSSSGSKVTVDADELQRLQNQLQAANKAIVERDQELSQMRITSTTFDNAMNTHSEGGSVSTANSFTAQVGYNGFQSAMDSSRPVTTRADSWAPRSNISPVGVRPTSGLSDGFQRNGLHRAQTIWPSTSAAVPPASVAAMTASMMGLPMINDYNPGAMLPMFNGQANQYANPSMSASTPAEVTGLPYAPYFDRSGFSAGVPATASNHPLFNDPSVMFVGDDSYRRATNTASRPASSGSTRTGGDGRPPWTNFQNGMYPNQRANPPAAAFSGGPLPSFASQGGPASLGPVGPRPGPVGSRLSPTAMEFPYAHTMPSMAPSPWNTQVCDYSALFSCIC